MVYPYDGVPSQLADFVQTKEQDTRDPPVENATAKYTA